MQVDKSKSPGSSNVVSLFGRRDEKTADCKMEADADSAEQFEQIMKKNRDVAQRMRKEREKANRSVLRSYRIKN